MADSVLRTVLIEVEGILNSKPLGYLSTDVSDLDPITPNLLLMGRRDASLPQAMFADTDILQQRRWRHSQWLADHFWLKFVRDYLPALQRRGKWNKEADNLKVGQVVLLMDPQLVRASWPVGKITRVMTGCDDRVKSAAVEVGPRVRPVVRLIPLPELKDPHED